MTAGVMFVHGGEAWVNVSEVLLGPSPQWGRAVFGDVALLNLSAALATQPSALLPGVSAPRATWSSPQAEAWYAGWDGMYTTGIMSLRRSRHAAALDSTGLRVLLFGGVGFADTSIGAGTLADDWTCVTSLMTTERAQLVLLRDVVLYDLRQKRWDRPPGLQRALGLSARGSTLAALLKPLPRPGAPPEEASPSLLRGVDAAVPGVSLAGLSVMHDAVNQQFLVVGGVGSTAAASYPAPQLPAAFVPVASALTAATVLPSGDPAPLPNGALVSDQLLRLTEGAHNCSVNNGEICQDWDDAAATGPGPSANDTAASSLTTVGFGYACGCSGSAVFETLAPQAQGQAGQGEAGIVIARSCLTCPLCPAGSYESQACTAQSLTASAGQTVWQRACAPWKVCGPGQFELTPPSAASDRVCAEYHGPPVPTCPSFTIFSVFAPATPPLPGLSPDADSPQQGGNSALFNSSAAPGCFRPSTSPLFTWPGVVHPSGYLLGRSIGDVCTVTCASGTVGTGPSIYVCGSDATWQPAVAVPVGTPLSQAFLPTAQVWPLPVTNTLRMRDRLVYIADAAASPAFTGRPHHACYDATPEPPALLRPGQCGEAFSVRLVWSLSPSLAGASMLRAVAFLGNSSSSSGMTAGTSSSWSSSAEATAQLATVQAVLRHPSAAYQVVASVAAPQSAAGGAPPSPVPGGVVILGSIPVVTDAMLQAGSASGGVIVSPALAAIASSVRSATGWPSERFVGGIPSGGPLIARLGIRAVGHTGGITTLPLLAGTASTATSYVLWLGNSVLPPASSATGSSCAPLLLTSTLPLPTDGSLFRGVAVSEAALPPLPFSLQPRRTVISDGLPPVQVSVIISAPLGSGVSARATCALPPSAPDGAFVVAAPDAAAALSIVGPLLAVSQALPRSASAALPATAALAANGSAVVFSVGLAFSRNTSAAAGASVSSYPYLGLGSVWTDSLACNLTSAIDGASAPFVPIAPSVPQVASLQQPLVAARAAWPSFSDALLHLPDSGRLVSAWTALLPPPGGKNASGGRSGAGNGLPGVCDLNPKSITAQALSPWTPSSCLPINPVQETSAFEHVVSGALNITLVADAEAAAAGAVFLPGTTIRLVPLDGPASSSVAPRADSASIDCPVQWVSADGLSITFTTPSYAVVCGNASGCGRRGLLIRNGPGTATVVGATYPLGLVPLPPTINPLTSGSYTVSMDVAAALTVLPDAALGNVTQSLPDQFGQQILLPAALGYPLAVGAAARTCAPFCPGIGSSVMPFALGGGYPYAAAPAVAALPLPAALSGALFSAGGISYIRRCVGDFPLPESGVCRDASNPLSKTCAFGEADACIRCPTGALCPGGYRAWPQPGYWSPAESDPGVVRCLAPAVQRCTGFDFGVGAAGCGTGYLDGSPACAACATGFYPAATSNEAAAAAAPCIPCPQRSLLATLTPALIYAGAVAGAGVIMFIVAALVAWRYGGTVRAGLARTASFVLWLFIAMQALVQVGRAASPGLPTALSSAYAALDAALQFGGIALHPNCTGAQPLQGPIALFATVLALLAVLGLLHARDPACGDCMRATATSRRAFAASSALALCCARLASGLGCCCSCGHRVSSWLPRQAGSSRLRPPAGGLGARKVFDQGYGYGSGSSGSRNAALQESLHSGSSSASDSEPGESEGRSHTPTRSAYQYRTRVGVIKAPATASENPSSRGRSAGPGSGLGRGAGAAPGRNGRASWSPVRSLSSRGVVAAAAAPATSATSSAAAAAAPQPHAPRGRGRSASPGSGSGSDSSAGVRMIELRQYRFVPTPITTASPPATSSAVPLQAGRSAATVSRVNPLAAATTASVAGPDSSSGQLSLNAGSGDQSIGIGISRGSSSSSPSGSDDSDEPETDPAARHPRGKAAFSVSAVAASAYPTSPEPSRMARLPTGAQAPSRIAPRSPPSRASPNPTASSASGDRAADSNHSSASSSSGAPSRGGRGSWRWADSPMRPPSSSAESQRGREATPTVAAGSQSASRGRRRSSSSAGSAAPASTSELTLPPPRRTGPGIVGTRAAEQIETGHVNRSRPSSNSGCCRYRYPCADSQLGTRIRSRLPRVLSLLHWSLLALLSALYALTCNAALRVFACSQASVTVRAYLTALVSDGSLLGRLQLPPASSFSAACLVSQCSDAAQLATLGTVIPVSVLDSDPAVVCWEGKHAPAAALAVLVLLLYTLGLPIASAAWLHWRIRRIMGRGATRAAWEAARAADTAAWRAFSAARAQRWTWDWVRQRLLQAMRLVWHCGLPHRAAADPEASPVRAAALVSAGGASAPAPLLAHVHTHENVDAHAYAPGLGLLGSLDAAVSCSRYCARRAVHRADVLVDADVSVQRDSSISFFTAASAELRPAAATFRHAQWVSVALLSVAAVLWRPAVSTPAGQAAKGLLCAFGLVALAHAGGALRPFALAHRWKAGLQYAITLLAAGGCALNAVNALSNPDGSTTASPAVTVLSFALVACGAALIVALLATFLREMILGAKAEAAAAAAAAAARGVAPSPASASVQHPHPQPPHHHDSARPAGGARAVGGAAGDEPSRGHGHRGSLGKGRVGAAAETPRVRRPQAHAAPTDPAVAAPPHPHPHPQLQPQPQPPYDGRTSRASLLKRDFARLPARDAGREGSGHTGGTGIATGSLSTRRLQQLAQTSGSSCITSHPVAASSAVGSSSGADATTTLDESAGTDTGPTGSH